jgi:hypothetical protein
MNLLSLREGHRDLLLGLPLVGPLGVVRTANVVAVVFFVASALGVYALAAATAKDRWAGAVAATLYMVSPCVLFELLEGRSEQITSGFVALFLLFAQSWMGFGRLRDLVLTVAWLAIAGVAYLEGLLMVAIAVPLLALGQLVFVVRG